MPAIVVLGVIALVGAIVAWVTWRRGADERESVQHHQHTIETLRHVADRQPPTVRPAPGRRAPAPKPAPRARLVASSGRPQGDPDNGAHPNGDGAPRTRRPTSPRRVPPSSASRESAKAHASRRETMVFSDETVDADAGVPRLGSPAPVRRMGVRLPGAAEAARQQGRARVQRTRIVAGTVLVVVIGAIVATLTLGGSSSPPRPSHHVARPITAAGHGSPATTQPTSGLGSSVLAPSAPTAFGATYQAPPSTYTVAIDASALCWVLATVPSTGRVVWTGTLAPGASHSFSVAGAVVVRLGAPTDARVTVDGRSAQLPAGYRSPFSLTFEAAA